MDRHVLVPLFESLVFANVVQVVASDDNRSLHLHLLHDAFQDSSPDSHVACERALLVDVSAIDRLHTRVRTAAANQDSPLSAF